MPFVPSFRTHSSSTSSVMLSFFLCNSGTVDEDEPFSPTYIPYSMRSQSPSQSPECSPKKKSRTKTKKNSKMVIGSPTNFRHDAHLGTDFKSDLSYSVWDSERWRQELMKKNFNIPPLVIHTDDTVGPLPPASKPKSEKRNSITPQKRKPVPSLSDLLPSITTTATTTITTTEPHQVPLPPSPTDSSQTFEDALSRSQTMSSSEVGTFSDFSAPSLVGHSSRGPSMDGDSVWTPVRTSEERQVPTEHKQEQEQQIPSSDTDIHT